MDDIIKSAVPQLGAIGLLVWFLFWTIRGMTRELKTERERNQALIDRLFTLATTTERTMAELTAAVKK